MSTAAPATQEPLLVYGTSCSYYTGKLEALLRTKGIAYRLVPFSPSIMARATRRTGVTQIPLVECPDGSWLADTTLILRHLEAANTGPGVSPQDPATAFVSRLIEDYGDEWLWRPAMHYRWSFPETARLMSAWLSEHLAERTAPQWLKRRFWYRRQLGVFVHGDGVTPGTRPAVEQHYLDTLAALEPALSRRPYVLGERPTEADFGLFASMFRHFGSDPAPARIMRERAPAVYEWVARLWNTTPERIEGAQLPERIPDDLGALFADIAEVYLPYLDANAQAFAAGDKAVSYTVRGTTLREPTKPYRVWCRDQLHAGFTALGDDASREVAGALGEAAVASLAAPSPRPAEPVITRLPIPDRSGEPTADSWWRR